MTLSASHLHFVQRLDARLHEARALGVVTELVNELLHVRTLRLVGLGEGQSTTGNGDKRRQTQQSVSAKSQ